MGEFNKNIDTAVNQVLPGAGKTVNPLLRNFGLNNDAVKAFLSDIKSLDNSLYRELGHALTVNSSPNDIRRSMNKFALYAGHTPGGVSGRPFIFSIQNLSDEFPGPAKFYNNNSEGSLNRDRWVLPMPPADFEVTVPNSQATVTTVHGFTYTHAGNIELDEISFESFFPYVDNNGTLPSYLPDYMSISGGLFTYHTPREWVQNLVTAMRANQPLLFSVYSNEDSGRIITDTHSMAVSPVAMSVASFNWSMGVSVGGSRGDVNYSITLKRWRRQSICITNYVEQPNVSGGIILSPIGSGKEYKWVKVPVSKVTIDGKKVGVTLFKLAQKFLGDGRRWKEIRELNPRLLKGKKSAYRPEPGTELKVPKK